MSIGQRAVIAEPRTTDTPTLINGAVLKTNERPAFETQCFELPVSKESVQDCSDAALDIYPAKPVAGDLWLQHPVSAVHPAVLSRSSCARFHNSLIAWNLILLDTKVIQSPSAPVLIFLAPLPLPVTC